MFNISGLAPEETILEAELHVHLANSTSVQPHVVRQLMNSVDSQTNADIDIVDRFTSIK
jgi:hypothetical protein